MTIKTDKPANASAGDGKKASLIDRVRHLVEPLCESAGMELVHIEYQNEPQGKILRFYIDKPGGVKLDDCADISRQAGDLLDVYLEDQDPYHLEVSSPGIERPLGKIGDFEKFSGRLARIRTRKPVGRSKNFKGILRGVNAETVNILVDDNMVAIPFHLILKARLVDQICQNGEN